MEFAVGILALAVTYLAWRNGKVVKENTREILKSTAENTEKILKSSAESTERVLKSSAENTERILFAINESIVAMKEGFNTMKEGFKILSRIIIAETPEEKRKLNEQLERL